ncbi:MAG: response regulator [Alcanivoracaceae bacterium]|nr:response regulator [Alcanivoracaceae bacterium]
MIDKLINFIQQSDLTKFFIVGLIIAIFLSASIHFSLFPWIAVVLSLLAVLTDLPFFDEKLTYDQKQQVIFNALLFSSISWGVFMWVDLYDFPASYALVYVLITISTLLLFHSLKHRLAIIMPVLIIFVALLFFRSVPTESTTAIFTIIFTAIFMLFARLNGQEKEEKNNNGDDVASLDKLGLISEIDVLKTDNQKFQNDIKQAEIDIAAAEMAKMEFLATMSHEIRTPLNGIIPLLDILLDSELSDFQRDYLSTAHISAIQMQKLIDDLLDYSKVEAGKLTVETRGLKIQRILSAVNSSYQQAAIKKNLSIEVEVDRNVSPLLRGDPTRVRQVLSNLLSNAIKFSNTGVIKLTAKKIKDFPNKEIIRFEVIDRGIGLDKETSDNIFLPFTQEDGSSTRKFGGTGLGLAISKKIVELMSGTIAVESKKGRGSNFYFDLPLLKSVGETSTGLSETSGYQAIIVNTNPLLFNKISQKLKAEDISFQKALGISQAYEIFASISKISKQTKSALMFIDFETAGKQVRSLCNDIANGETMEGLFACVLSDHNNIAGIPKHDNIMLMTKDDSIGEILNKIEVFQASKEADEEIEKNKPRGEPLSQEKIETLLPEILLVEDNEVNLKVAEKLIQYIGYPFDFAMNGQEALEKVKQNRYRMILMDCQMPVMDGYRCTAKIRDYEAAAGLNRTPILAMTANAMMGDREKCLDAGMDDYMSKPLNRFILEKTLRKWDPLVQQPAALENMTKLDKSEQQAPASPVIDKTPKTAIIPQAAINQKWLSTKALGEIKEFMGDEIVQLLEMFEQETPSILKKINIGLQNKNFEDIQKMAHMLKSTSANIGANGLSFFSRKMELAAKNEHQDELFILYNKVRKSYILTTKEIAKYVKSQ